MKISAVLLVAIGCLFGRGALGSTQMITNGGFEALSPAPWQPSDLLQSVPVVAGAAHSGNNYLSLGNFNGVPNGQSTESVFQTIEIPTNTLVMRFTYFWGCSSGDPAGVDVFSSALQLPGQAATFPDVHFSANSGYQLTTLDFNNYAGKSLNIGFAVQALTNGLGVRTFFAIDDVSLLVFTADDIPANDNFTNATLLTTTTNVSVTVTNIVATKEAGEPKHAGAQGGHSVWWRWVSPGNGVVTINTTNSTFNTVLAVYTGTNVSHITQVAANDDQDAGRGILTSQVKFNATAGTEYKIVVDGKGTASGVAQLNLSFTTDTKAPTVAISSPKSGAKLTNSTVTVQGTASDNLGVSLVQYRLENAAGTNDYQNATGTNNWTATVADLIPGPNTIRVRSFDTSGNPSPEVASTVSFVVVSPLQVIITPGGGGTVTPNLNQTLQPVGNTLTLTAKPAPGLVFSNWAGDLSATTPTLTFMMQSNMVLFANFVPNPFIPLAGAFQGLFLDTNGPMPQSAGSITLTLATPGSFSAKLLLAGKSSSLSGQFSAAGSFSNNVVRKGLTPLSVQLDLDFQNNIITGHVSDGTFSADLLGAHVLTSAGAAAGSYTLLIPGSADGSTQPGGDGYATIKISPTGAISLAGALADGTKIAQKANLLIGANWAFYVPLYSGKGSISGFLHLTNDVDNDITGDLLWAKLPAAGGTFYPGGFTFYSNPLGSAYHFTSGVPVLNAPAELWLANGNLATSFTNQVAMDSASKVTSTNATLKMTITTSTGAFKGTLPNPAGGKAISFNGVILQNQNFGGGFFLGTNQTGRVFFGP